MEEQQNATPTKEKLIISKQEAEMRIESILLQLKPYVWQRWAALGFFAFLFLFRMFYLGKYYAVGYIAGLYILQCFVLFISPKMDPGLYGKDVLPTATDDDYKPFVRKLPEFTFWRRTMAATLLAFFFGLLPFDLPVYGPLLLVYFLAVTIVTFRTHITQMIKYKYIPFDFGKPKYQKPSE